MFIVSYLILHTKSIKHIEKLKLQIEKYLNIIIYLRYISIKIILKRDELNSIFYDDEYKNNSKQQTVIPDDVSSHKTGIKRKKSATFSELSNIFYDSKPQTVIPDKTIKKPSISKINTIEQTNIDDFTINFAYFPIINNMKKLYNALDNIDNKITNSQRSQLEMYNDKVLYFLKDIQQIHRDHMKNFIKKNKNIFLCIKKDCIVYLKQIKQVFKNIPKINNKLSHALENYTHIHTDENKNYTDVNKVENTNVVPKIFVVLFSIFSIHKKSNKTKSKKIHVIDE